MKYPWKSKEEFDHAETAALSELAKIDVWTASLDEVSNAVTLALQSDIGRASQRVYDAATALSRQYVHALNVQDARRGIEGGSGLSLMFAVNECLRAGLIAPKWLAEAFVKRFKAVDNLEARSWDDDRAFGPPFPGEHIDKAKEAREASRPVFETVEMLRAGGMPTGEALWEAAAEALGRDVSQAGWVRDVYYATVKVFPVIDARLGIPPKPARGRPKKSKS